MKNGQKLDYQQPVPDDKFDCVSNKRQPQPCDRYRQASHEINMFGRLLIVTQLVAASQTNKTQLFRVVKKIQSSRRCQKVMGGPTKHETHLTPIAASIILILFFTAGHHDFLFSTWMNLRDDRICKSTKYHGNLQYWI